MFYSEVDDILDIESVTTSPGLPYDVNQARILINECHQNAYFRQTDDNGDDWEEKIQR